MNNYNYISGIYGWIKKLIFSDVLEKIEVEFLLKTPKSPKLLVIGCGHAKFLKYLNINDFSKIVLVDKSKRMLKKAKASFNNENIEFKNEDWMTLQIQDRFDIVAMPFILDCIPENDLNSFINKSIKACEDKGQVVVTDFEAIEKNSFKSKVLIKIMYLFFSITTNVGRQSTPLYEALLTRNSLRKIIEYRHPFLPIFTASYTKL